MWKNIAVTGYSGTGSSAVIDYLKGKKDFTIALADNYEHVVLYYPNSIFDLKNKVIDNNDPLRSDEAIKSFMNVQDYLYENDFGWFGSYEKLIGKQFREIEKKYLEHIIEGEIDAFWYYNYKGVRFSLLKCFVQLMAKMLLKRPIYKWGRKYIIKNEKMLYSFIDEDQFLKYTKEYITEYANLCKTDGLECNYIFDHLVWPTHVNYDVFDETFYFIILHRDPRDLFFINKYYWCSSKVKTPGTYPLEVHEFCKYFKALKRNLSKNSDHVLNVNFEDLVYKYDEEKKKINRFLGIEDDEDNLEFFDPKKSIVNTQVFIDKSEWKEELAIIEEELTEYLYDFPYENKTEIKDMFL